MKKKDRTRETILREGLGLFLEKGLPSVSMEMVAGKAGCHRRTLYRHFPQKEDLLYEMVTRLIEEINIHQRNLFQQLNGRGIERFVSFLRGLTGYMEEHRMVVRLMGEFDFYINDRSSYRPGEQAEERFSLSAHETESILADILKRGLEDGSLRLPCPADVFIPTVTTMLWGAAQRLALRGGIQDREFGISGMEMVHCQIDLYVKAIGTGGET